MSKKAALLWPSISTSSRVAELGLKGALVYTWLLPVADRQGRLAGDARRVKALVVPLMEEITAGDVEEALQMMQRVGLIVRYPHPDTGRNLIQVADWWEYNAGMRYVTASKWPPPEGWEDRQATGRDELGKFTRERGYGY